MKKLFIGESRILDEIENENFYLSKEILKQAFNNLYEEWEAEDTKQNNKKIAVFSSAFLLLFLGVSTLFWII